MTNDPIIWMTIGGLIVVFLIATVGNLFFFMKKVLGQRAPEFPDERFQVSYDPVVSEPEANRYELSVEEAQKILDEYANTYSNVIEGDASVTLIFRKDEENNNDDEQAANSAG